PPLLRPGTARAAAAGVGLGLPGHLLVQQPTVLTVASLHTCAVPGAASGKTGVRGRYPPAGRSTGPVGEQPLQLVLVVDLVGERVTGDLGGHRVGVLGALEQIPVVA